MLGIDPRAAKVTWTVFLIGLAIFITYSIRTTILVIIFSIFFAYLLFPLVRFVERHTPRRFPRTAALALVFILVIAGVTIGGALLGNRIVDEASRLALQLPKMLDTTNLSQRIPLPAFLEPQRERLVNFIMDQLRSGTGQALPFAQRFGIAFMHTASNLLYLVLVPILSFLLIKEAQTIKKGALSWLSKSNGTLWTLIAEDLNLLLSSYVRALMLLSIATFISYGLVLSLLGVPYAALLAGAAAIMEVIPVVGPIAAALTILAVSIFSGYDHILWIFAFVLIYRLFQDYALGPFLMGKGVEISSLMVICGLLAGEELGGIAGIFLSVPVLAAAKIIFVKIQENRSFDSKEEQSR
jgi:predicted PurR-regulated permease PerM